MKSKQRVMDYGEVFTPPALVAAMLDLIPHECERIESRFLEPACGTGNFLVEVLWRKIRTVNARHGRRQQCWERDAVVAVSSLYGIDLLPDNVAACRERLLEVVMAAHLARFRAPLAKAARRAVAFILERNIVRGNALTFRDADEKPIILSEWSPLNGNRLKRRDFSYSHLLEHAQQTESGGLFSDLGKQIYLPEPVDERPPCHYLGVATSAGAAHDRP